MVILRVSLDILDDVLYHIQAGCLSTKVWSTHTIINNISTGSITMRLIPVLIKNNYSTQIT